MRTIYFIIITFMIMILNVIIIIIIMIYRNFDGNESGEIDDKSLSLILPSPFSSLPSQPLKHPSTTERSDGLCMTPFSINTRPAARPLGNLASITVTFQFPRQSFRQWYKLEEFCLIQISLAFPIYLLTMGKGTCCVR